MSGSFPRKYMYTPYLCIWISRFNFPVFGLADSYIDRYLRCCDKQARSGKQDAPVYQEAGHSPRWPRDFLCKRVQAVYAMEVFEAEISENFWILPEENTPSWLLPSVYCLRLCRCNQHHILHTPFAKKEALMDIEYSQVNKTHQCIPKLAILLNDGDAFFVKEFKPCVKLRSVDFKYQKSFEFWRKKIHNLSCYPWCAA